MHAIMYIPSVAWMGSFYARACKPCCSGLLSAGPVPPAQPASIFTSFGSTCPPVWDNMRRIAGERYQRGEMPAWFKPEWLEWEEAPTNTFWRQLGREAYWQDDTWLGSSAPPPGGGEGGGGGSGGGSGRGGWRWWREEDPYWPMRDWGDHPMRWWTWGFAALLAGV
jgi:hypothetical protein